MAAPTASGTINSIKSDGDSITISFSSISGATSYDVAYRKTSVTTQTEVTIGNNTSYTITGLAPHTSYVVNYRGRNSDGVGPYMSSGSRIATKGQMYVYTGSTWRKVKCYVYTSSGWKLCNPAIYDGGWND